MQILTKSIEKAAQVLALDPEELQLWLEQYPNLTPYTQIQLLRMATKYQLDPLSDEIGVMETNEGYQAFITIDGWVKLINSHEQYAGMSLREAPIEKSIENSNEKEALAWMECTIYRHDRILPIVVKEYLDEVKTDHPSWQQMPRRMLRHRVIQQCARLAFGISQKDMFSQIALKSEVVTDSETIKDQAIAGKFRSIQMKQLMTKSTYL
ncbi:recombinase RecT [Polynucleobacter sp. MWH-Loch1C5]|uniref:recombinase RecT n=1 Tax=Polynucleobacter sp. MWH-Loch1C5 TaxID=2689108 RepID=UPI001C0B048B|nr:recombinase RecT [Polynucleobacter sp. MWH-Loch1C5]MBU3543282.1 recombinase RecT [Polynucleobacter sp. MWH-Loch1C5]